MFFASTVAIILVFAAPNCLLYHYKYFVRCAQTVHQNFQWPVCEVSFLFHWSQRTSILASTSLENCLCGRTGGHQCLCRWPYRPWSSVVVNPPVCRLAVDMTNLHTGQKELKEFCTCWQWPFMGSKLVQIGNFTEGVGGGGRKERKICRKLFLNTARFQARDPLICFSVVWLLLEGKRYWFHYSFWSRLIFALQAYVILPWLRRPASAVVSSERIAILSSGSGIIRP